MPKRDAPIGPQPSAEAVLADRLKQLRVDAGLSLRGLGEKFPLSHSRIADFESGKSIPTPQTIAQYEELFRRKPGSLMALREDACAERAGHGGKQPGSFAPSAAPAPAARHDEPGARRPRRRLMLAGVAVAMAVVVAIGLLVTRDATDERRPAALPAARVLVAIDRSAEMGCPFPPAPGELCDRDVRERERRRPPDDRGLTGIGAARTWAGRGTPSLDQPGDELGIRGFFTAGSERKLDEVLPLGPRPDPASSAALYLGLTATSGRSPLYDMIDVGVDLLRVESPAGAANTLVVLTHGVSSGSSIGIEELHARLAAGAQRGQPPVRVLVTAIDDATCDKLRKWVVEPGDGDCFPVRTQAALECLGQKLPALLRAPQPAVRRDDEAKERDRRCP